MRWEGRGWERQSGRGEVESGKGEVEGSRVRVEGRSVGEKVVIERVREVMQGLSSGEGMASLTLPSAVT